MKSSWSLLLGILFAGGGCLSGDRCDPGMEYVGRVCRVVSDAASSMTPMAPPPATPPAGDGGACMPLCVK